eukprot:IDg16341t1
MPPLLLRSAHAHMSADSVVAVGGAPWDTIGAVHALSSPATHTRARAFSLSLSPSRRGRRGGCERARGACAETFHSLAVGACVAAGIHRGDVNLTSNWPRTLSARCQPACHVPHDVPHDAHRRSCAQRPRDAVARARMPASADNKQRRLSAARR